MASNTNPKENKMGVMPVKRLIISMALPMMISMLVQALYNVVDSIFVARLGEDALSAVTYAFPLQNLMIAVGSGTGVGMNALLSRSLGEKRFDKSDSAANMGIFLTFCSFIAFLLFALFGSHWAVAVQLGNSTSESAAKIIADGHAYLSIVTGLSLGLFFQMTFERLLQSTGRTQLSMISQTTGAVINIIFDPIMIFGLFGFPRLGVAGAAYATVLGQSVAALLGLFMNLKFNSDIHLSRKSILRPDLDTIKRIYAVGVPSILMISIGSIMTYGMNMILTAFSTTATAVFGVYFKLQSFFFMPVFGLNNGLIPVLAYNYGALRRRDHDHALRNADHAPLPGCAARLLQCGRGNARDRHPGAENHQPVLPLCRHRHHLRFHLPGLLTEYLLSDYLARKTAGSPAARRLAPVQDRGCHQCLVGLPHRGGRLRCPLLHLLQEDLWAGREASGEAEGGCGNGCVKAARSGNPLSQVSQRNIVLSRRVFCQKVQSVDLQRKRRKFMTTGPEHLSKELFRF